MELLLSSSFLFYCFAPNVSNDVELSIHFFEKYTQELSKKLPGVVSRLVMPVLVDYLAATKLRKVDEASAQGLLELLKDLLESDVAASDTLKALLQSPKNIDTLLELLEGSEMYTTILTLEVGAKVHFNSIFYILV